MENNIAIRAFTPSDKKATVKLLSSFYDNIDSEEKWDRLYSENPYGSPVISLAEESGGIIGHYSVIRMPVAVFDKVISGGKGEGEIFDLQALKKTLLANPVLGRSISTDLLRHALKDAAGQGIGLICTNPSDLALKSHVDAGFKVLKQHMDIFICPLKAGYLAHLLRDKTAISRITGLAAALLMLFYRLLSLTSFSLLGDRSVSLEAIRAFDVSTDMFDEMFRKGNPCITIKREHRHLNWRFGGSDYRKFIVRHGQRRDGYMVVRVFTNPNGFKEACLVDYMMPWPDRKIFGAAVIKAVGVAVSEGCDLFRINYMYDLKERFYLSQAIKRLLFLGREDKRNIVVYAPGLFGAGECRALDIGNWYFTDLYFDGY
jgi:hypothetical protein